MKKQKTENLKTNKGITLIALVITIIVMLILVAVTISMAVNGGLFEYASNAGAQTNAAVEAEQQLANLEANMTVDALIEKYSGITASTVKANPNKFYGKVVTNYTLPETNTQEITWKIFLSDGENIYLIACDDARSAPAGAKGTMPTKEEIRGDVSFKIADVAMNDYEIDDDGYIIPKSSLICKWIDEEYLKSTYDNMKAVAYMLDINQWNILFKGNYADYAIGGPTIKMYIDSYNAIHATKFEYKTAEDGTGYLVRIGNGDYGGYGFGYDAAFLDVDPLGLTFASPGDYYGSNLLACEYHVEEWGLMSKAFGKWLDFRPVICLNSKVILEGIVDGQNISYRIK